MNTEAFDGFWITSMSVLLCDMLTNIDLLYHSILQTIYISVLSLVLHYQVTGLDLSTFLSFLYSIYL